MNSNGFLMKMDIIHDENSLVRYIKENVFHMYRDLDYPGCRFYGSSKGGVEVSLSYTSLGPMVCVTFKNDMYDLTAKAASEVEGILRRRFTDSQLTAVKKSAAARLAASRTGNWDPKPSCHWAGLVYSIQEGRRCIYCRKKSIDYMCEACRERYSRKRKSFMG